MKKKIFLLFILFFFKIGFCQIPSIEWQGRYGGTSSNASYDSKQTSDGGYIIGGRSNSNSSGDKTENSKGGFDYWVLKLDANGVKEWDKTIGGTDTDTFYSIIQSNDGGYVICGTSSSITAGGDKSENNIGQADYWVVKLSSTGTIEWENTIGGNLVDEATCIIQTNDNGYLIGGYSKSPISGDKTENSKGESDFWIVKLNSLGQIQWDKTIGGSNSEILTSMLQLADDTYVLFGRSGSNISGDKSENSRGGNDYWIVKLDNTSLNVVWQKTIGGSLEDMPIEIIQTTDNGFLLGGYSYSSISGDKTENSRGSRDYWVIKLNDFGIMEWQKTIGGSLDDNFGCVIQAQDNGYLLCGNSISPISGDKTENIIGAFDGWLVKLNETGTTIEWQKAIGGTLGEGINSISNTFDGGYFLSGLTNSPISGDILLPPIGQDDYWVVKLQPEALTTSIFENDIGIVLYPNPANNFIYINNIKNKAIDNITIYDINGRLIKEFNESQTYNPINISMLSQGLYIVIINLEDRILKHKFFKN